MPAQQSFDENMEDASSLSTIAILRRHPMYDSLVLIKKYSPDLEGYSLEFPSSPVDQVNGQADGGLTKAQQTNGQQPEAPAETKPVQDGECILGKAYDIGGGRTKLVSVYLDGDDPICQHKLKQQNGGDRYKNGEVVYVPINGLLHRLNNYDKHGVSIDSRVYAFAMGLKTAERFLTSSTEKEVQEAPPL